MTSKYFLHTTASKFEWGKDTITSHTDYGADLDIHVLSPGGSLTPNEKEGPFGAWSYADPTHGKEDPYPFQKLKYITLNAAPNVDYVTLLHPRKADGAPIATTLLEQTKDKIVIKVIAGGRTDLVTLTSEEGAAYQRGEASLALPLRIEGDFEPGYRAP
jgi:hypothetical protein